MDQQPNTLQLEYATPSADGVLDWIPEAEALIDSGKGPNEVRQFFKKSRDASAYYAKSVARRYTQDDNKTSCDACGSPATQYVTLQWKAIAQPHTLELMVSAESNAVPFTTHHLLCDQCIRSWRRKSFIPRWIMRLSNWIIFAVVVCILLFNAIFFRYGRIPVALFLPTIIVVRVGRFAMRKLLLSFLPAPIKWLIRKHVRLG